MPEEAALHAELYRLLPDVRYIEATADDAVVSFSLKGAALPAMLDDAAQMMGPRVKNAGETAAGIAAAVRGGRRAALFTGRGALSFAETRDEAVYGKLILEKNAAAYLTAELFGGARPLPLLGSYLQHQNYVKNYSKRNTEYNTAG
jgi:ribulose-5-phosphate 4-epimerase/fuculose-1-phosphate aldolase